ncbi:hypothetical protein Acr_04g0007670 [Actinidia rufa]|uniref:Retrotransposon gag domain-containing protein n=1 Tax=Actinidia rufa TaxID=165716 RepID=A0A7J0EJB3_9ERIC|nr:hypothetical protein Acr_04g0007670 [Actinidia rufa]
MHLCSRLLPRPSVSSPLDNRAYPMANTSQALRDFIRLGKLGDEEGLIAVTTRSSDAETDPPTRKLGTSTVGGEDSNLLQIQVPTQLGVYEGKTDPMGHLDSYKNLMSLQGYSDEVMCKAFYATLKGSARSWFRKLTLGTIDTFGDLSRLFIANFMSYQVRQKSAFHLFTIHQKEIESFKDYVKRFNHAILEVEDPSDKVVIMAIMEGLCPGSLSDSLSKNVLETLSTLQSKADKYISVEELAEAKRRRRGRDDKRKELEIRRADYRDEARNKRPNRDSRRQTNYSHPRTLPRCPELVLPPLNAPIAQVLTEIKHEEFIKWPGKIKTDPRKRNKNMYWLDMAFWEDGEHFNDRRPSEVEVNVMRAQGILREREYVIYEIREIRDVLEWADWRITRQRRAGGRKLTSLYKSRDQILGLYPGLAEAAHCVDEVTMESLHLELVYGDGEGSMESLTLETTYLMEIFLSVAPDEARLTIPLFAGGIDEPRARSLGAFRSLGEVGDGILGREMLGEGSPFRVSYTHST